MNDSNLTVTSLEFLVQIRRIIPKVLAASAQWIMPSLVEFTRITPVLSSCMYVVVTIGCKVYIMSLAFTTWNWLTKGLSTMITYFLTPGIRGLGHQQYLANNVWLKVPAKRLFLAVHFWPVVASFNLHRAVVQLLFLVQFPATTEVYWNLVHWHHLISFT